MEEYDSPMEPPYAGPVYEPEPVVVKYDLDMGPPQLVPRMRQYNEIMDQIHALQHEANRLAHSITFLPAQQEAWVLGPRPNYSPVVEPVNPRGRVSSHGY